MSVPLRRERQKPLCSGILGSDYLERSDSAFTSHCDTLTFPGDAHACGRAHDMDCPHLTQRNVWFKRSHCLRALRLTFILRGNVLEPGMRVSRSPRLSRAGRGRSGLVLIVRVVDGKGTVDGLRMLVVSRTGRALTMVYRLGGMYPVSAYRNRKYLPLNAHCSNVQFNDHSVCMICAV
ncbi:hypothetical protein EXIGLDRAFT_735019 [Exidia glandulosa HHB12029]|uniref:Uncharacterized protein n=1 Tax=Exidia glandulosa HHB12029 TaxID=1314781 RepID=A0A165K0K5_EXIGL|nr:hypothetical protein EXIGLDRAFT_735019 [Exidia glandulosa HHB12029]